MLVCFFTGIFAGVEVYLGQRVWPDWQSFTNLETAFMDVCQRVGGMPLFQAMGIILVLAALGSGLTGGLGAARLLFGMGRDGVLPRKFFAHLHRESGTPHLQHPLDRFCCLRRRDRAELHRQCLRARRRAAELRRVSRLYGSQSLYLLALPCNLCAPQEEGDGSSADAILPLAGFIFCAFIWWNLNTLAKVVGGTLGG